MKLASIETILAIEPIANADKIVLATVQGWQAVIKKDEFNVGDEVVFVPVDTLLQRATWNEFLFKDKNATEIRLKTVKLRGVYSQGLILPIEVAGNFAVSNDTLAEMLGVTKYEKPLQAQMTGQARGGLPSWLRRSDEDNLQTEIGCFAELQACAKTYAYLKMDGSSFKAYLKDGEFGVCSRGMDLKETPESTFWRVARELDLENKFRKYGHDICVCGEICGPGIQGNKMGLDKVKLYVYDFWSPTHLVYYNAMTRCTFAAIFELEMVPAIQLGDHWIHSKFQFADMKAALTFVNAQKYPNGAPAEGIVFRGQDDEGEVFSPTLRGRLSVKLINQNYKD